MQTVSWKVWGFKGNQNRRRVTQNKPAVTFPEFASSTQPKPKDSSRPPQPPGFVGQKMPSPAAAVEMAPRQPAHDVKAGADVKQASPPSSLPPRASPPAERQLARLHQRWCEIAQVDQSKLPPRDATWLELAKNQLRSQLDAVEIALDDPCDVPMSGDRRLLGGPSQPASPHAALARQTLPPALARMDLSLRMAVEEWPADRSFPVDILQKLARLERAFARAAASAKATHSVLDFVNLLCGQGPVRQLVSTGAPRDRLTALEVLRHTTTRLERALQPGHGEALVALMGLRPGLDAVLKELRTAGLTELLRAPAPPPDGKIGSGLEGGGPWDSKEGGKEEHRPSGIARSRARAEAGKLVALEVSFVEARTRLRNALLRAGLPAQHEGLAFDEAGQKALLDKLGDKASEVRFAMWHLRKSYEALSTSPAAGSVREAIARSAAAKPCSDQGWPFRHVGVPFLEDVRAQPDIVGQHPMGPVASPRRPVPPALASPPEQEESPCALTLGEERLMGHAGALEERERHGVAWARLGIASAREADEVLQQINDKLDGLLGDLRAAQSRWSPLTPFAGLKHRRMNEWIPMVGDALVRQVVGLGGDAGSLKDLSRLQDTFADRLAEEIGVALEEEARRTDREGEAVGSPPDSKADSAASPGAEVVVVKALQASEIFRSMVKIAQLKALQERGKDFEQMRQAAEKTLEQWLPKAYSHLASHFLPAAFDKAHLNQWIEDLLAQERARRHEFDPAPDADRRLVSDFCAELQKMSIGTSAQMQRAWVVEATPGQVPVAGPVPLTVSPGLRAAAVDKSAVHRSLWGMMFSGSRYRELTVRLSATLGFDAGQWVKLGPYGAYEASRGAGRGFAVRLAHEQTTAFATMMKELLTRRLEGPLQMNDLVEVLERMGPGAPGVALTQETRSRKTAQGGFSLSAGKEADQGSFLGGGPHRGRPFAGVRLAATVSSQRSTERSANLNGSLTRRVERHNAGVRVDAGMRMAAAGGATNVTADAAGLARQVELSANVRLTVLTGPHGELMKGTELQAQTRGAGHVPGIEVTGRAARSLEIALELLAQSDDPKHQALVARLQSLRTGAHENEVSTLLMEVHPDIARRIDELNFQAREWRLGIVPVVPGVGARSSRDAAKTSQAMAQQCQDKADALLNNTRNWYLSKVRVTRLESRGVSVGPDAAVAAVGREAASIEESIVDQEEIPLKIALEAYERHRRGQDVPGDA